ncbi:MAG: FHA domain-containing protein, partial [Myxococcota bacterium]
MSLEGKPQGSCLEVLVKREGRPYLRTTIGESPAIIGREGDVAIRLESKKVSRNHARLEFDSSTVQIIDSGSRNGFRVDGEVREKAELSPANTVKLCDFEFRIRLTSKPRMPPGSAHYYHPEEIHPDRTAPSERARLLADRIGDRIPEAPTKALSLSDELSEGWAEIAREGEEDTNITRQPVERKERVAAELGFVERSVMNQLAFARSHADVEAAVGDDLDEDDVDEYIRPDVE